MPVSIDTHGAGASSPADGAGVGADSASSLGNSVQTTNFYQYSDAQGVLRLNFLLSQAAASASGAVGNGVRTLFVLDKSGSMGGSPWKQVLSAVDYIVESGNAGDSEFIVYDSRAYNVPYKMLKGLSAGSMTNFGEAFEAVRDAVSKYAVGETVHCVFMTDGHDTCSKNLTHKTAQFNFFLSSCERNVVIHTIGFGSYDARFLTKLRAMTDDRGSHRDVAYGKSLDVGFSEVFDFLSVNKTAMVRFGAGDSATATAEHEVSGFETEDSAVLFDVALSSLRGLSMDDIVARRALSFELVVGDTVHATQAAWRDVDMVYEVKVIEAMDITDKPALDRAQTLLSAVNPLKFPKYQREEMLTTFKHIQERLDEYHQLFADIARGNISKDSVVSKLASMRYDVKFKKARRTRLMNKRAGSNTKRFDGIDAELSRLRAALGPADLQAIEDASAQHLYDCALSGDTFADVMTGGATDIVVQAMCVVRPEHAIDAPTALVVERFVAGYYSNDAFQMAMQFAIARNPKQAHGGFTDSKKVKYGTASVDSAVGYFKGPDGVKMNGCLPCYISAAHGARVLAQIEPLLGNFFTLDPLGFKGDQYLALFGILGNMVVTHKDAYVRGAADNGFAGSWARARLDDFTKLCVLVMPKALAYIAEGRYAGGDLRTDPVDAFIASPRYRSRQLFQNLLVLEGWRHARNSVPATALNAEQEARFSLAFAEETVRRGLNARFKATPREFVMKLIEKLMYAGESDGADAAVGGGNDKVGKDEQEDARFAVYGKLEAGELSKAEQKKYRVSAKNAKAVRERLLTKGVSGLVAADEGYVARSVVPYSATSAAVYDKVIDDVMASTYFVSDAQRAYVAGLSQSLKWTMILQSLRFFSNDKMNAAIKGTNGTVYLNTYDVVHSGDAQAWTALVSDVHENFERTRREGWAALMEGRNDYIVAAKIASAAKPWVFAGRMMVFCPTRGGKVFDNVVSMLCAGSVDGSRIPLLEMKVRTVLTGKFVPIAKTGHGYKVHANGESWIHCPLEKVQRFKEQLGDAFTAIELSMYGSWGWVYRASDLPNRHGHCNSNPNPDLAHRFSGFGLE